jgi:hypothetical protein
MLRTTFRCSAVGVPFRRRISSATRRGKASGMRALPSLSCAYLPPGRPRNPSKRFVLLGGSLRVFRLPARERPREIIQYGRPSFAGARRMGEFSLAMMPPQKRTPSKIRTLGWSVLPQPGFFSWAAGVGGWGAAQLGLMHSHLAMRQTDSMRRGGQHSPLANARA